MKILYKETTYFYFLQCIVQFFQCGLKAYDPDIAILKDVKREMSDMLSENQYMLLNVVLHAQIYSSVY